MRLREQEKGEREGLIGRDSRDDNDQRRNSLKNIKENFFEIDSIKDKFKKNKKSNSMSSSKTYSSKNLENAIINKEGGRTKESRWEMEESVFFAKKEIKKKGLLGGKVKRLFKHSSNNANNSKSFLCHNTEDDDGHSISSGYLNGDKKKIYKKRKTKVSSCEDEDLDAEYMEKRKSKKRKKPKKIAKKVGSKTWKGVKAGWKFLSAGLMSLSAPLGVWDVSLGVSEVLRRWTSEKHKREQLLKSCS